MPRRTKAEAEKTRQKILKAALDLFAENGYERTTFEDVAARIRLSKGAIYWHFKSKPELFAAMVADITEKHTREIAAVLPAPTSLNGLTAHFVERAKLTVGRATNRRYFLMMLSMDWPAAKFIPIKRRLRTLGTSPFVIIEDTLTELCRSGEVRTGTDVAATTSILGALWLGLMKLHIDQCLETDLSAAIRSGFAAVIDTIKA